MQHEDVDRLTDAEWLSLRATREFWRGRIRHFGGLDQSLAPDTPEDQRGRAAFHHIFLVKPLLEHSNVLELGCGSARCSWIPEHSMQYIGVDFLEEFLALARRRQPDCRYVCCSARRLPFPPETFDIVLGVDVASSLAYRFDTEVLPEVKRVLKPLGMFVLAEIDYVRFAWKT